MKHATTAARPLFSKPHRGMRPPVQPAPVVSTQFSLQKWLSGSCQTYNVRSFVVLDILFRQLTIVLVI